ncbi:TPA: hypothetical protein QDZ10_003249 [Stenotrophomonas maltophilia]|nr:hypothetical protein [Stenotrophomonas maltophilia]
MNVKLIGNSILLGTILLVSIPGAATAAAPVEQTSLAVTQVSTDVDKASFVERLTTTFQTMAASESTEARAAGVQYLDAIKQPGITGLIEQFSYPPKTTDARWQPGSTRVSQWCGTQSGYLRVFQVTEKYMETTRNGSSRSWVPVQNSATMVATCPDKLA